MRACAIHGNDAATVADVLVWANLRGVDSHGVLRVPKYVEWIEAGDLDTLREIYAPDAVILHNDDLLEQPVDDNLKVLQGLHRALSGLRYDIVRRAVTDDGVLQQHVLRGRLPNGAEVERVERSAGAHLHGERALQREVGGKSLHLARGHGR